MRTNNKFIVVGLGEVLWDILPDGKKLGGAPTNFAYHANCLGAQGYIISCVGNDIFGKEIINSIDELELNRKFILVDDNHPTGTVTIKLDKNGIPDYIIHEDVAWDFIPSNDKVLEFAQKVDAVCFGALCQRSEISRNMVRKFLKATKKDCFRIFDINIRQHYYSKDIIESMLEFANIFKLNDEELLLVAKLLAITGTEEQILQKLISRYSLKLIALTKGSDGSILISNKRRSQIEVKKVPIVDTVGAGDAFTAAIAIGLLQKKPIDRIHSYASRLAGYVCTQKGATPKLPKKLIVNI